MASRLFAGAAAADITPGKGIQLAGDIGSYRPVETIHDPLFARALVLQSGGRKVCWVTLDVLAMSRGWADRMRARIAGRYGFDVGAVLVHVLQNHAAPSVGHCFVWDQDDLNLFPPEHPWLLGGDDRYNPVALEGVMQAVGKALAGLQPVRVQAGRGLDGRVAFNRRFIMRDGTGRCHPANRDPNILQAEGPVDPEVGVMLFHAQNGKTMAAVLHHSCHPCHWLDGRSVGAGWPGAWCNGVRRLLGKSCVPLVFNGFCGNIHPCNHLDPAFKEDPDGSEFGRKLTETVAWVLNTPTFTPWAFPPRSKPVTRPVLTAINKPGLDWRCRHLQIPMRRPADQELKEARRLLKKHPRPIWRKNRELAVEWDWVYAAMCLDLMGHYRQNPNFDFIVQAFRLGEAAILAVHGEPFVEEQLRLKRESPFRYTWMAHMSNGYVGYIPTAQALARGGYETDTSNGSKLVPAALKTIGDAALKMLQALAK